MIIKTSATVHISGANICILYQIYNNKNQLIVYLLKKNSISFFVIQGFIILFKYYFVDINSGYEKEYRRTAGDDSRYFYASSYANLSAIETDVIAAITKCPVTQPVTTTDGSLMFADVCKYILCVTVSLLVWIYLIFFHLKTDPKCHTVGFQLHVVYKHFIFENKQIVSHWQKRIYPWNSEYFYKISKNGLVDYLKSTIYSSTINFPQNQI